MLVFRGVHVLSCKYTVEVLNPLGAHSNCIWCQESCSVLLRYYLQKLENITVYPSLPITSVEVRLYDYFIYQSFIRHVILLGNPFLFGHCHMDVVLLRSWDQYSQKMALEHRKNFRNRSAFFWWLTNIVTAKAMNAEFEDVFQSFSFLNVFGQIKRFH